MDNHNKRHFPYPYRDYDIYKLLYHHHNMVPAAWDWMDDRIVTNAKCEVWNAGKLFLTIILGYEIIFFSKDRQKVIGNG